MVEPSAESTIPGLYVIGETAGGVRGPDRPGGNSLAEGQVFGHRAGVAAAGRAKSGNSGDPATLAESVDFLESALSRSTGCDVRAIASAIREKMQRYCLVEKDAIGLTETLETVRAGRADLETAMALTPETLVEGLGIRNMAQACEIVLAACMHREETRSSHNRLDFPDADDARFGQSFVISRSDEGPILTPHRYGSGDLS